MDKSVKNEQEKSFHLRKKTSFTSDVFTLISGTTFAQILTILIAPLLTRLYSPEDFGLQALFLSIAGILGVIVCLRYELSIMLPQSDEEAANLLFLSLLITLVVSILTIPFIWVTKQPIISILRAPQLGTYLWLIPVLMFVTGVSLSLNYWNSRTKQFRRLSSSRIINSVINSGTQLGAGFAGYAAGGSLIGANLAGLSISTFFLCNRVWKDDNSLFQKNLSFKKIVFGLKRYRKFPLIDTWSVLLNTISWQLPAFLLAFFFSPTIVGFYSFGFQLLQLPMNFIGSSVSQVFFQRASEARSEGTLPNLVESVFRMLVIIGMFPILILTIIGSDIFTVVFGKAWTEAGVYVQILSIWVFVWFISSPLSTLYIIMEKQHFGLKYNLINFITRLLSLVIGGFLGDVRIALSLFSISGIFVYGYLCIKTMLYSGVELSSVKKIIISNLNLFVPAGLILIVLKIIGVSQIVMIVISCFLCMGYYLYIIKTDSQLKALSNIESIKQKFGFSRV